MKKYILYSSLIHLLVISSVVLLLVELEYITLSSGGGSKLTTVSLYNESPAEKDSFSSPKLKVTVKSAVQNEEYPENLKKSEKRPINNTKPVSDSKKRFNIAKNSSKISKAHRNNKLFEQNSDNKTENETETGGNDYRKGEKLISIAVPEYGINPKPKYPMSARRRGYEGEVIFRVLVLDSGNVGKLEIFKSSGYDILDNSAQTTLQKWKFIPRKLNGTSVSSWVKVPILFRLNDA